MTDKVSSDESMVEEEVIKDFDAEAKLIIETGISPKKSANRYQMVYESYKKWQTEHRNSLSDLEESNLIVYFTELSKKLKPPTLWSIWSMLKKTLNVKDNVDISKFHNFKCLIKNNSKGNKPKKSYVFTWNEIMNFMNNAPDLVYLVVILVFGICGGLRCDEITELKVQGVEDLNNSIIHAATPSDQFSPQPSTSGDDSVAIIDKNINEKSQREEAECDNFDNFDMNDVDLAKIDELYKSKISDSPATFFTSAKSKKVLTSNNKSHLPTHSSLKSPVKIFSKESENIPPSKRFKPDAQIHGYNQLSDSQSIKTAADKTICNRYESCVFHGNIVVFFFALFLMPAPANLTHSLRSCFQMSRGRHQERNKKKIKFYKVKDYTLLKRFSEITDFKQCTENT
ncbi:Protein of unknown function [Cotesia congregata]|uniref:Uncharacterized protein n=1 Tax=Cotesia congregata TaxID=51543 RepID=A0A8J2HUG6_COTCN|nr:Protein of unknown function [Cotesia congregata]